MRKAIGPPGIVRGACGIEAGDGAVVDLHERVIPGRGLDPRARDLPQHLHRIVRGVAPQRIVETTEYFARVGVPAPPQINGEIVEAAQSLGQWRKARGPVHACIFIDRGCRCKGAVPNGDGRDGQTPAPRPVACDVLVQCRSSMRIPAAVACACLALFCLPAHAFAQDPPPPLPRMVLDVRGSTTNFSVEPELAQSRGLLESELPGRGFGGDVALHFYLLKLK